MATFNSINSNVQGNNTFLGSASGNITLTGDFNIGIGSDTLNSLTAGLENVGVGYNVLTALTTGQQNVCIGNISGTAMTIGNYNTAVGTSSSKAITTGEDNTALGTDALNALVTGDKNLALGSLAASAYTGAESSNICIAHVGVLGESNVIRIGTDGAGLGQQDTCYIAGDVTTARSITATTGNITATVGDIVASAGDITATLGALQAGTTVTAGTGVTATTGNIVATAGQVNAGTTMTAGTGITSTTGDIVATAGAISAGTTVTAGTGITATTGNITATTGDLVSTAGAVSASTTVTGGTGVTATTGAVTATAGNVVITAGNLTLPNTNGAGTEGEITFGGNRWISNFGTKNTFVGEVSGNTSTSGTGNNTAIGYFSGNSLGTGAGNTCLGQSSGKFITTGSGNVAIGGNTLSTVSGSSNIALGNNAGSGLTGNTGSNICISNIGSAGVSNTIWLGTTGSGAGQQNKCFIAGTTGITPDVAGAKLMIMDTAGQMGTLGAATNGQIAIGSTGANPVLAELTAGSGIDVTNGAGSISIATSASTCSFSAYLAADDPNVTGNGTDYQLGTNTAFTEVFDTGTNFNTNGTFTAPTTGVYALNAQVVCTGCTIATTFELTIVTTTRTYITKFMRPASADDYTIGTTILADMTATNTAVVKIKVSGEAGDTVDLASANTGCRFSGNRLY